MKPITLIYAILATGGLYLIENLLHPTYGVQMIQKIILFLVIPVSMGYFFREKLGVFGVWKKSSVTYGVGFGILSMMVIAAAYFLLASEIDWIAIGASMEARHITESTFILVFAYIMFGNSLLEEYFFRGVIFQNMRQHSRVWAYIGSALMFSLYHMTIFSSWFAGYILALALFGLFAGGVFFAWLYEKTGGIWSAWIFHIFADLAILVIGYQVFFL